MSTLILGLPAYVIQSCYTLHTTHIRTHTILPTIECRAPGRTAAFMDLWWCEAIVWWRSLVQAGYSPDRVYEWAAGRWGYRVAYDLSTVAASASEGSSSASVAGAVIGHAG